MLVRDIVGKLRVLSFVVALLSGLALWPSFTAYAQQLPALIVNQQILQNHWIVRDEDFLATTCSVQEGGVQPGTHRVLRFTVNTPHAGASDLALCDSNVHVANTDGLYAISTPSDD